MGKKETILNVDIAIMYLEAAFFHYGRKEFVVAIHLAGAAEEILGDIAMEKTKSNALMERIRKMDSVHNNFGSQVSIDNIMDRLNLYKNKVKHIDIPKDNSSVTGNFELEADLMILRAIDNYDTVFGSLPTSDGYYSYLENGDPIAE